MTHIPPDQKSSPEVQLANQTTTSRYLTDAEIEALRQRKKRIDDYAAAHLPDWADKQDS